MVPKYVHKHILNLFNNYPENKKKIRPKFIFKIHIIGKNDEYWNVEVVENDKVTLKIPQFIDYFIKIENTRSDPKICYTLEHCKINGRNIKISDGSKLFCFDQYLINGYSSKCSFISVDNTVIELKFKQWNIITNNKHSFELNDFFDTITLVDAMNIFDVKVTLNS